MKPVGIISTALALFLLLGTSAPAFAQGDKQGNPKKQNNSEKQGKPGKKGKGKLQVNPEEKQSKHPEHRAATQQEQDRPPGWNKGKKVGWGDSNVPPGHQARLPQERQRQLIMLQQQRLVHYRRHLDSQQPLAKQFAARLQQQNRMASYRFQQEYLARLRRQHAALQHARDYNNDPFYYTAPIYRYNRSGSYYETNEYGANLLRQAVNYGYEEGFRAGKAAQQDRWASPYQDSYAYQDANYGYDGYYVDQADYNHYFREGFRRGYEDGYNSRYQYGQYSGGSYNILGGILTQILNLESLR